MAPRPFIVALAATFLLSGCATPDTFKQGRALIEAGDIEGGLAKIEEAAKLDPDNKEYRIFLVRQRELAVHRYIAIGQNARTAGSIDEAETLFRKALALGPANARVLSVLEGLDLDRQHRTVLTQAAEALKRGDTELAYSSVRAVLGANPSHREALTLLRRIEEATPSSIGLGSQLRAAFRTPLTLEFRDATLRQIFELISRNTGLNFLFDREVRPDLRATIFVRDTSVEDAIRFLLVTNQLDQKVLNESTLLIYPKTAAKQREYQDLAVKSFYVTNADVKQTANLIKSLVKTNDVFFDEKVGLVIVRDTPEAVRMVGRLLASQDLADPEVVLDVEVLEVSSQALDELGIRYPDQLTFSIVGAGGAGTFTLREWLNRNSDMVSIGITNPAFVVNFREQIGRANLLANPKIRVRNREKAKVHVGDKVPVITTTTSANFVSESVNYLDVGLKLEVEPTVHLENEVGIRVNLEVSNIVREVKSAAGALVYQLGTRNAATVLRLKDGETQILAGLINSESRSTANRVPGLGSLPILGRLFGSQLDNATKSEIVLLITPRIVRTLARPDLRMTEFLSGTEAAAGAPPIQLQTVPPSTPTGAAPHSTPRPSATGPSKVSLQAPAQVVSGQEFKLIVSLASDVPVRSAVVALAFDPSRFAVTGVDDGSLLKAAGPDVSLSSNIPEGLGRVTLSVDAKKDIPGTGELAVIRLRGTADRPSNAIITLEAATLTDANGRVVPVTLPPPFFVSLIN